MSIPRTIPDRTEWHSLRPPLEPGELALAELLDDTLPPGWVIAVQAQLWNSRPDVIAYNPEVGLGVFEVKDWDPDARQFRYSSERGALQARSGSGESRNLVNNPSDPHRPSAIASQAPLSTGSASRSGPFT